MANTFLNAKNLGLITKEAVFEWKNNNSFLATATRDYDKMWDQNSYYQPGDTIQMRLPNTFLTQTGDTVTAGDIKETSVPLVIEENESVTLAYSTKDFTTDVMLANWKDRILWPAVRTLSSRINQLIAAKALTQVANYTGDETANINAYADVDNAGAVLDELANSRAIRRYSALAVRQAATLRQSATLQNSFVDLINKEITLNSKLGRLAGFDMFAEQSIPYHITTATVRTGITVKTTVTPSGTNSIVMTGFASGAADVVIAGDVFEIAGFYSVNPITKQSTGQLKKFVATANASSTLTDATITVYPAVIFDPADPNQNITAAPTATSAVTFPANHHMNMAWGQDGLCVVCPRQAPLDAPYSESVQDPDTGYTMRLSKTGDVLNNKNIFRLDVLWGATWLNDRSCRILSL